MRLRFAFMLLVLALFAGLGFSGAAAQMATPVASPASGAPLTMTLVERAVHVTTVKSATGSAVGTIIVWGPDPLYNAANTQDTGATTQGSCIAFDPAGDCVLTEVIVFADGSTLQLQGIQPGATVPSTRIIVGGSGRFRGASGTVAVTPSADGTAWTKTFAIWP